MSPFFDDLERQLHAAAARARAGDGPAPADPRPPRRGWLRAGLRAAPAAVAVATTLAIAAGALLLLAHRRHPAPSGAGPASSLTPGAIIARTPHAQLLREVAFIGRATQDVVRLPACHVRSPLGVRYVHGSPGPDLLSILGVLRRPATAADRLRAAALAAGAHVYAGHIRRAAVLGGVAYYIVPTRNERSDWMPSDRCFALQKAALARRLPSLPAALRGPTRTLQAAMITYDERLAAETSRNTICLVTIRGNSSGADCGLTPAAIERGQAVADGQGTFSAVVPDGVASVTLRFPAVAGRPARSVRTVVHGNLYAVRVPYEPGGAGGAPTVVWRSANGGVLKRIVPPRPQTVSAYCRTHPLPCVAAMSGSVSVGGGQTGSSAATSAATGSRASTSATTATGTGSGG